LHWHTVFCSVATVTCDHKVFVAQLFTTNRSWLDVINRSLVLNSFTFDLQVWSLAVIASQFTMLLKLSV
jgi:hypothetical protein